MIANCLLLLTANLLGLTSYYLADKQQRRAFLETRQSLEMKLVIEEQSTEQVCTTHEQEFVSTRRIVKQKQLNNPLSLSETSADSLQIDSSLFVVVDNSPNRLIYYFKDPFIVKSMTHIFCQNYIG